MTGCLLLCLTEQQFLFVNFYATITMLPIVPTAKRLHIQFFIVFLDKGVLLDYSSDTLNMRNAASIRYHIAILTMAPY